MEFAPPLQDDDLVLIGGYGLVTRQQARSEAAKRLIESGVSINTRRALPIGYHDLTNAFVRAINAPEYVNPYQAKKDFAAVNSSNLEKFYGSQISMD